MSFLDPRTLILMILVISSCATLTLFIYGRTQRTYAGYRYWLVGNLFVLGNYLALGMRGLIPDLLSLVVGNVLGAIGTLLHLGAIQHFVGKPRSLLPYLPLIMALLGGLYYFTYAHDDLAIRNVFYSATLAPMTLQTAAVLWRAAPHSGKALYRVFAATVATFAVVLVLRTVWWFTSPDAALYSPAPPNTLFFVLLLLFETNWTFFFIVLNNQRMNHEIHELRAELEQRASFDALTGVYNRRKFIELGEAALTRAQQTGSPLSLIMFDLDWFKGINDEYGHAAGDEALKQVAATCQALFQRMAMVGRFGGDEFLILYPSATHEQAMENGDYLRETIKMLDGESRAGLPLSISYGVAELNAEDRTLDDLIRRADMMLYERKRQRGTRPRVDAKAILGA